MLADDESSRARNRLTLAAALSQLAVDQAPVGTLGAGGSTALIRVRRLASPAAPLAWGTRTLMGLGLAGFVVVPMALAISPTLSVISAHYCPLPMAG